MNAKKAKAIRRIANAIAQNQNLADFQLMAKRANPHTAIVSPQTKRGVVKVIKRAPKVTPIAGRKK
jgi:hypothetical protein